MPMSLCTNRPEGFGPLSHIYGHILTSCFFDTVLVPLCTWLYLVALLLLYIKGRLSHGSPRPFRGSGLRTSKTSQDVEIAEAQTGDHAHQHTKTYKATAVLYHLFLLAQFLMCILEIVRLSLAHLGVGLLPFTFVTLVAAAVVRFTDGLGGRMVGWRYSNLGVWIALAVTNGVKVAEEAKEGAGMRKGSKYPVADEITDVSVMIGVYAVLAVLEASLRI